MSNPRKKLYLIDVSSLFFRAFYAIRPLHSLSGVPTNAVYGFLTMVLKLFREEKPEFMVFCHDRKEPSFRKDLDPNYKANRSEMPEDLVPQIPFIKQLAELLGIPSVDQLGFEADDLIGTLTKLGLEHQFDIYIVSGDKDFAQLIEDHVWIFDTMKDIKLDTKGVKEKWGILPEQMIDYLAIVGDSSDNVPGVSGLGPKGAQKLLEEFGSLDGIYKNVDKIKSESVREKLTNGKKDAYLSQTLVTIRTDVKISNKIEDYHLKPVQKDELQALLTELNFKNMDKMLQAIPSLGGVTISTGTSASVPAAISTTTSAKVAVRDVSSAPGVSTSSASTAQSAMSASVNGEAISVSIEAPDLISNLKIGQELWAMHTEQALYISDEKNFWSLAGDPAEFGRLLSPLELQWKGYDLKNFFHRIHWPVDRDVVTAVKEDLMLAAYVQKPGEKLDFDYVYSRFTGKPTPDLPMAADYFQMLFELSAEIKKDPVYYQLDLPLVSILYRMESLGVKLDVPLLQKQSAELLKELQTVEKEIISLAGESFNIASPKQLGQILFEKLKLPTFKKTKTGFSTDEEVLEKLREHHPIADKILLYREVAKLKSTYVDALPTMVKEDGRIHSTFNQATTTTGRLSSTDPNLQNIPIRTERGARIRKAFIAEENQSLLSVDYSQIELRILAHYSNDKNLIQAFHDDLDIHAATASEVFSVPLSKVTSDMRRTAKAVNFGIAYGQGVFGLAENLGIARGEASEIIKRYFSKFPGVDEYIQSTIQTAQAQGYVETLYGRRRYMDELKSSNPAIKKFGERAAINAPIQGTASDIVRQAMIELDKKIPVSIILQVHDELIFEAPKAVLEKQIKEISSIMENIIPLKVPLKVNASLGVNWDEAH